MGKSIGRLEETDQTFQRAEFNLNAFTFIMENKKSIPLQKAKDFFVPKPVDQNANPKKQEWMPKKK